jgi:hypothetical protein
VPPPAKKVKKIMQGKKYKGTLSDIKKLSHPETNGLSHSESWIAVR